MFAFNSKTCLIQKINIFPGEIFCQNTLMIARTIELWLTPSRINLTLNVHNSRLICYSPILSAMMMMFIQSRDDFFLEMVTENTAISNKPVVWLRMLFKDMSPKWSIIGEFLTSRWHVDGKKINIILLTIFVELQPLGSLLTDDRTIFIERKNNNGFALIRKISSLWWRTYTEEFRDDSNRSWRVCVERLDDLKLLNLIHQEGEMDVSRWLRWHLWIEKFLHPFINGLAVYKCYIHINYVSFSLINSVPLNEWEWWGRWN